MAVVDLLAEKGSLTVDGRRVGDVALTKRSGTTKCVLEDWTLDPADRNQNSQIHRITLSSKSHRMVAEVVGNPKVLPYHILGPALSGRVCRDHVSSISMVIFDRAHEAAKRWSDHRKTSLIVLFPGQVQTRAAVAAHHTAHVALNIDRII
jgi:hypothetical protein